MFSCYSSSTDLLFSDKVTIYRLSENEEVREIAHPWHGSGKYRIQIFGSGTSNKRPTLLHFYTPHSHPLVVSICVVRGWELTGSGPALREFVAHWKGACFYQGWNSRPSITLTELTAIQQNQRSSCQQSKGFSWKESSRGLSSGRGVPSCQQDMGILWVTPPSFLFSSYFFPPKSASSQIHSICQEHRLHLLSLCFPLRATFSFNLLNVSVVIQLCCGGVMKLFEVLLFSCKEIIFCFTFKWIQIFSLATPSIFSVVSVLLFATWGRQN